MRGSSTPFATIFAGFGILLLVQMSFATGVEANAPHTTSFDLVVPISCAVGTDCFVQNYVDHGQQPVSQDYTCGHLTYPGHHGTDFRLRNLDEMDRGVEVIAAAPGVVIGMRDGEPDISVTTRGAAALAGREGGNGVVIDHGNGWRTQYSHMRQGSVRVHMGQTVAANQVLGLVGLSGNTEFPHLDLEVSHFGAVVDPFAPNVQVGCGGKTGTLWSPAAARALRYRASGILNSIMTGGVGEFRMLTAALRPSLFSPFTASSPQSVYFVELFGLNAGDEVVMTLKGPHGAVIKTSRQRIFGYQATTRSIVGDSRPPTGWQLGSYIGAVELVRGGVIIESARAIQKLP